MIQFMQWLEGKKTYTVAAGIVLLALAQWLMGNATLAEALNEALKGLGLAALRAGVARTGLSAASGNDKRVEQLERNEP